MPRRKKGSEYPAKSGIIICQKINPTGTTAYRVDIPSSKTGQKREQRQFPTKREAEEYARQRHTEISQLGHAAQALTSKERQDAVRAIEILKKYGLNLENAAHIAAKHSTEVKSPLDLNELRNRFLASPGRKKNKLAPRRESTLRGLHWRTARFVTAHPNFTADEIQQEHVQKWLNAHQKQSPVSLNNLRRAIHAMFSYAVNEGYCARNPVARVPLFAVPEKSPSILTVEESVRLLESARNSDFELGLLAYGRRSDVPSKLGWIEGQMIADTHREALEFCA